MTQLGTRSIQGNKTSLPVRDPTFDFHFLTSEVKGYFKIILII